MSKTHSFIYRNSLSMALIACFLLCLIGQIFTGWHEHNNDLAEYGASPLSITSYLSSGHFLESTFENWESEFLQMAMYVLFTVFLRQRGSSESKDLDKKEEVDREPNKRRKNAPWPVMRGGFILKIYQNSLSLAFGVLFILSFVLHFRGSLISHNEEQILKGLLPSSTGEYLQSSEFWFESFQNWQSEFVAVLSIVVLSIFLRQKGSPESKPVDAGNWETGE